jgi:hypothetical protein
LLHDARHRLVSSNNTGPQPNGIFVALTVLDGEENKNFYKITRRGTFQQYGQKMYIETAKNLVTSRPKRL